MSTMWNFTKVVFFLKILSCFVLSRKFGKLIHDLAHKYQGLNVSELRKFEKLHTKFKKAELDVNFLSNCKTLNVIPKFLCFRLPNTDLNEQTRVRKSLLRSATNKRIKERDKINKLLNLMEIKLRNILNGVDFYLLKKAISKNFI